MSIDPDTLPWSNEAEQSVLGGLLLDNSAWDRVADILDHRLFFSAAHSAIYTAIGSLVNSNKPADVITVADRIRQQSSEALDAAGGMKYLHALSSSVPSAANARRYAEIVAEKHSDRALRETADEALSIAQGNGAPHDRLERIVTRFAQLERQNVRTMPVALQGLAIKALDRITERYENNGEGTLGLSTGFPTLDALMHGFQPGRIYLLGARPSIGKSALAEWWALNTSLDDGTVSLFLSQEMPEEEVTERGLAMVGKISYERVQTGMLQDSEWGGLSEAVEKMGKIEFHVDAQPGLTISDIRIKARYIKRLGLLVLDYVQLCKGAEEGETNRNTELEIISRGVKELVKQLGCAVLILSQLARRVDERKDKRAIMSDLKDCGGLEQDADVIMTLFHIGERPYDGYTLVGMDVLKHRQGKKGSLVLEFYGHRLGWGESPYKLSDLLDKKKTASSDPGI